MKQYNLVKEDIEQNIDEYIISSEVIENVIDQGTKTLKTIIKIKINDTAINNKLSALSLPDKLFLEKIVVLSVFL